MVTNPLSFVVFDEVDVVFDEANVKRFGEMLVCMV
jgi:chromosome segregation ATPase